MSFDLRSIEQVVFICSLIKPLHGLCHKLCILVLITYFRPILFYYCTLVHTARPHSSSKCPHCEWMSETVFPPIKIWQSSPWILCTTNNECLHLRNGMFHLTWLHFISNSWYVFTLALINIHYLCCILPLFSYFNNFVFVKPDGTSAHCIVDFSQNALNKTVTRSYYRIFTHHRHWHFSKVNTYFYKPDIITK